MGAHMEKQLYFEQIDRAYDSLTGKALEERLLELLEQSGGEYGQDSAFYASMLSELGGYYRGQARYEESAGFFRQARELLAASVGENSPDYATAVNNLAGTYRLMGRLDEAEQNFQTCLELYRRTVGEAHILYASGLNNLSLVCLDRGDVDGAAELLGRASAILAAQPGCRDELASSLCNLAALHRQLGRPEQAESELRRAVELYETELGVTTPHYHAALNAMGLVCYDGRRYREALDWFTRAAQAAETLYGREHRECRTALRHAGLARQALEGQP